MRQRSITLFLFFFLFVASAGRAWACGNDGAHKQAESRQATAEQSCCSGHSAQAGATEDQPSCPCDHDNGACHCPGCGAPGHSGSTLAPEVQPALAGFNTNVSVQKQAFYFAGQLPEAVYLPIWQPPKIGA